MSGTFEIVRGDGGTSSSWTTMRPAALCSAGGPTRASRAAWPERDGEFADKKRLQLSSSAVVGDGIAIQVYTRT